MCTTMYICTYAYIYIYIYNISIYVYIYIYVYVDGLLCTSRRRQRKRVGQELRKDPDIGLQTLGVCVRLHVDARTHIYTHNTTTPTYTYPPTHT